MRRLQTRPLPPVRLLLVALYSERYPAVGETHGLSVVAGSIVRSLGGEIQDINVLDLVATATAEPAVIAEKIREHAPNVVGLSVPYGTYSVLMSLRSELRCLLDQGCCVVVGGALPTYVGDRILSEVDPRLVVVVGEGESAIAEIIDRWRNGASAHGIVNSLTFGGESLVRGLRELVRPESVPLPYRAHLKAVADSGAQIFLEASRACSWAACTFCLRGLTDIDGRPREFRRLPPSRLAEDIAALVALGVTAVTFADEDFLGGSVEDVERFAETLATLLVDRSRPLRFDVSATIRSIFDSSDGPAKRHAKRTVLETLRSVGLNKVFLGVESGSPTQLRRYRKGHTAEECVAAAELILAAGIRLELGFIMFDPLCTLREVAENVEFLLSTGLAQYASGPTSELRLQVGCRYLTVLEEAEKVRGQLLYERELDPDTLSYHYSYADPDVGRLVEVVRAENERSRSVVYRLKGLTRFGDGQILGESTKEVRHILATYRERTLAALRWAAENEVDGYRRLARDALTSAATDFVQVTSRATSQRPIVRQAIKAAQSYLEETSKVLPVIR